MKSSTILITLFLFSFVACTPSYLKKYTKRGTSSQSDSGPASDIKPTKSKKSRTLFGSRSSKPKTPSVYAIDEQTYRFKANQSEVWDSVLSVLLKNYNLNIVDRSSGVVTTEWDKFVLHDNYYRNKVSIRVRPLRSSMTQVTVHNSVEKLQRSDVGNGFSNLWLPVRDEAKEVARIIQNVSVVMNFQPPANVRSSVAKQIN